MAQSHTEGNRNPAVKLLLPGAPCTVIAAVISLCKKKQYHKTPDGYWKKNVSVVEGPLGVKARILRIQGRH